MTCMNKTTCFNVDFQPVYWQKFKRNLFLALEATKFISQDKRVVVLSDKEKDKAKILDSVLMKKEIH